MELKSYKGVTLNIIFKFISNSLKTRKMLELPKEFKSFGELTSLC